jgi:hypothetical protein
MLVHRQYAAVWENLADRVGLESAQQFYDHITQSPDQHRKVGSSGLLRGTHQTSPDGDEHRVVRILVINLGSR